ncbi:hypothetical protein BKA56DRAFT_502317, partial [Ilyonectria sp. MPI-CAGE-AT-0026]
QILRATHKIAQHSGRNHNNRRPDPFLIIAAVCTAINTALRINMLRLKGHRNLFRDVIDFRRLSFCFRFALNSLLIFLCRFSFISLGLYGVIYAFTVRRVWIVAGALFILQYVGYALYVVFRGVPSPFSLALGIAKTSSPDIPVINIFLRLNAQLLLSLAIWIRIYPWAITIYYQ